MSVAVLPPTTTVDTVLEWTSFILGKLPSHPLAAVHIPLFEAQQQKCFATHQARTLLEVGIARCRGAERGADDGLDDFVDVFDRTLLIITKNDRTAAIYQLYFGNQTASELARPMLGDQLTTVRAWLPSIQSSQHPAITALAPRLLALVADADLAVETLRAARQALKDFDVIGPRKELIDGFNALCKTVHGELAALPHKHPEAMLLATFADRFFPHVAHTGITSITSVTEIDMLIGSLTKDLAAAEAQKKTIVARAAAKAEKKETERLAAGTLAAAKEEEKEVTRKRKEAERALKDAKRGKGPKAPPDVTE
jgi:hypothetical protein